MRTLAGWAFLILVLWAVVLGWLVSPWLELAAAVVLAGLIFYALEAPDGR